MADDSNNKGGDDSVKKDAEVYHLFSVGERTALQKFIGGGKMPDAPDGVVGSNVYLPEDEYQSLYVGGARDRGVLEPPYNLLLLDKLGQENNALLPCIEAMVTNLQGTGSTFEKVAPGTPSGADKAALQQLTDFFNEPWPGESFDSIRRKLRRDVEKLGNAYLEIMRNPQDQIVFLRYVDAKMMRLVKLDDPIPVKKTVRRNGKDVSIMVQQRERRYVQLLNGLTIVYFRDFGSSRDLNKDTGIWAPQNKRLPAQQRATEILHFVGVPDVHTPYGVPRWINQLPSVLGSRKAEEFNLEFFDNGGVPPVLIVLQGGTLQTETRRALEQKLGGRAKDTNRVQILEVEPTGGSLDKPIPARVTVERFGGDRTKDSMFESYDDKCEARIRRAFRLPPLFVGQAADHNFATAYVAHSIAEAQVFRPEREAGDSVVSMRLLPAMGFEGYQMRSHPLVIEDLNNKMQAISMLLPTGLVAEGQLIDALNEATGFEFKLVPEGQRKPVVPGKMLPPASAGNSGNAVIADGQPQVDPSLQVGGTNNASHSSTPAAMPRKDTAHKSDGTELDD
jgi:PBSX family phage portal protein